MKRIYFLMIVLALLAMGCAQNETPAPTAVSTTTVSETAPAATEAVEIKLFQFPKALSVVAGTAVTWTNMDDIIHSVTSGTPDAQQDLFDSDFFDNGESYTFTFSEPGTYEYFCRRHNFMQGTVTVTESE